MSYFPPDFRIISEPFFHWTQSAGFDNLQQSVTDSPFFFSWFLSFSLKFAGGAKIEWDCRKQGAFLLVCWMSCRMENDWRGKMMHESWCSSHPTVGLVFLLKKVYRQQRALSKKQHNLMHGTYRPLSPLPCSWRCPRDKCRYRCLPPPGVWWWE